MAVTGVRDCVSDGGGLGGGGDGGGLGGSDNVGGLGAEALWR